VIHSFILLLYNANCIRLSNFNTSPHTVKYNNNNNNTNNNNSNNNNNNTVG